jgi:predicted transcriptional regulator
MKDTAIAGYIDNNEELKDGSIQSRILKHINEYPGVRYRELSRLSHLVNGILTYHLLQLERSNQIVVNRSKTRTTRYYPINMGSEQSEIVGYLNETGRRTTMDSKVQLHYFLIL